MDDRFWSYVDAQVVKYREAAYDPKQSLGRKIAILKRFTQHVSEQNWLAVWLDLAIVFLAVFVGLQADNWNEERIARLNAKVYYARLIDDLRAEEVTRLARIDYYQTTLAHGKAALQSLGQPEHMLDEEFLVNVYQVTQIWNYTPQRATYDELLSMGIANAVPDVTVRSRLANYYLGLENSKQIQQERMPFRQNLRRYMPHIAQNSVRRNCVDQFKSGDDGVVIITLPEECELDLDPTIINESVKKTLSYDELEIDLTQSLADLENKLLNLSNYLAPTQEIMVHLAELAD